MVIIYIRRFILSSNLYNSQKFIREEPLMKLAFRSKVTDNLLEVQAPGYPLRTIKNSGQVLWQFSCTSTVFLVFCVR